MLCLRNFRPWMTLDAARLRRVVPVLRYDAHFGLAAQDSAEDHAAAGCVAAGCVTAGCVAAGCVAAGCVTAGCVTAGCVTGAACRMANPGSIFRGCLAALMLCCSWLHPLVAHGAQVPESPAVGASLSSETKSVITRYCIDCHSDESPTAGLNLQQLLADFAMVESVLAEPVLAEPVLAESVLAESVLAEPVRETDGSPLVGVSVHGTTGQNWRHQM